MLDTLNKQGKTLVFVFVVILVIIGYLLIAHVTQYLWLWYIVPLTALPPLTFFHALGLRITLNWLTGTDFAEEDQELEPYIKKVITACLVQPLIYLFIGWLISNWL